MGVETLSAWLLAIMMTSVPPGKSRASEEARESAAQGKARYAAISRAIARVALDPKESALYSGKQGRKETAALMLAIAYHESHFRRDVDLGLGKQSKRRYHCLMQIAVHRGRTPEGWTARDLVTKRERCFRRALHILQRGKRRCGAQDHAFLKHYASGYCDRGRKAVHKRIRTWRRWLREHPMPARR